MELLRTDNDIRNSIHLYILVYNFQVMSCIHENSWIFFIVQLLGNTYLKICQVSYVLSFPILWWNSWGQISLFPAVCRYYNICNDAHNKFYEKNGRFAQWDGKSTCISKILATVVFIPFTAMRFGLMQVKTGLCHILSRFEVAPCKQTTAPVAFNTKSVLLQMQGEIRLSFNRMHFWNNVYVHIKT